ncbi:hypothetical protein ACWYXO_00155 [Janthinobacterium aestuarii]
MADIVKKFIRAAMAGCIEVILAGILFTISIVLREKKTAGKKRIKIQHELLLERHVFLSASLVALPAATGVPHGYKLPHALYFHAAK